MGLLTGKRAIVLGVANDHSLAWFIARKFHQEGATLALTHAGAAFERRVRPLAEEIGVDLVWPCDVLDDSQVAALSEAVSAQWPRVDILVHAIAFAQRDDLKEPFSLTSRQGFRLALEVSTFSFVQLVRALSQRLGPGSSLLTLTYFGAEKVIPNYNVMGVAKAALEACVRYLAAELGPRGVRVNAVSAGPVRTLSAAGIPGFRDMLRVHAEKAPLRRNVTPEEVAQAALFLASDLASGITGEILHVDAGYNILGF